VRLYTHKHICISANVRASASSSTRISKMRISILNMSISHCTRGRRRQHGAPHISEFASLIFFKYVPAPMTAFRYCVCWWWNESWSAAAPALGVLVDLAHTRARTGWRVLISTGGECAGNGKKWNQANALFLSGEVKHEIYDRVLQRRYNYFWKRDLETSSSSFSCFFIFHSKKQLSLLQ
jgi:hypothetical protein